MRDNFHWQRSPFRVSTTMSM